MLNAWCILFAAVTVSEGRITIAYMNIRKRTWESNGERGTACQLDWRRDGKRYQKQFRTRQEAELYRDKSNRERYAREYDVLLEASFAELVITLSRGLIRTSTTLDSNGMISARGFLRSTVAATSAATSTQRTAELEPFRYPVTGECIDPEISGNT